MDLEIEKNSSQNIEGFRDDKIFRLKSEKDFEMNFLSSLIRDGFFSVSKSISN